MKHKLAEKILFINNVHLLLPLVSSHSQLQFQPKWKHHERLQGRVEHIAHNQFLHKGNFLPINLDLDLSYLPKLENWKIFKIFTLFEKIFKNFNSSSKKFYRIFIFF